MATHFPNSTRGGNKTTLGAVGDIGFHRSIGAAMLEKGIGWPFEKMRPELSRADLLFGTMESVALTPDFPKDKIDPQGLISSVAGPDCAEALRRAGFGFMNMAANHVLDAGTVGMFYTEQCLRETGIMTGGIGKTQTEARRMRIIERNGVRFGFLCYCEDNNYSLSTPGPCHAYYQPEAIVKDVKKNRDRADIIVVSIHADIEFMETPSVPRVAQSRIIAEAGADIILAHHPHVPQGIEVHHNCLIAYSLGNFVFDSHSMEYMKRNGPHTAHSFLLLIDIAKKGVRSFERVPFIIPEPPEERPHPATGARKDELLAYFAALDRKLQDEETVRRNWSETARKFVAAHMAILGASDDPDVFIRDVLPRMLFVAEDRSVMNEVYRMASEYWDEFKAGDNTHTRPKFRLNRKQKRIGSRRIICHA